MGLLALGRATSVSFFDLQGVLLWAYWASGCAASMSFLTIRACCFHELFGLQGELLP